MDKENRGQFAHGFLVFSLLSGGYPTDCYSDDSYPADSYPATHAWLGDLP